MSLNLGENSALVLKTCGVACLCLYLSMSGVLVWSASAHVVSEVQNW